MIGKEFRNTRRVVILVEDSLGEQHGFDMDGATVKWEWTGMGIGPRMGEGSTGRLTVEGRMHRKTMAGELSDQKEITDGQAE